MKLVLALGGNAILRPEQKGTYEEVVQNVREASKQIEKLVSMGHQLVLTHGNGPQVGNIALQQAATTEVPENPLHVLGAMTQGEIGYLVQRELGNVLRSSGVNKPVISLITQTLVSEDDPSFTNPTKPIGPFYTEAEAKRVQAERGFVIKKVAKGGPKPYRRVVPSPDPVRIIESDAIVEMIRSGSIVVAGGGGGIPVIRRKDSSLDGIDAVIDKDLDAERLAEDVGAEVLLILTNVDAVKLDFGTPRERSLDRVTVTEAKQMLAAGQFPLGSMGPKVLACIRFVEHGGKMGIVASLEKAVDALQGKAGTRVVPG
ncbi:MAG: carbamate kinase [Nitrososphaerota archaeon]|nr:carbamate kinase [Nitrososphaerota archaeon]MDG7023602.1 carbamate kinase [Nitrososphaerota archaeon]